MFVDEGDDMGFWTGLLAAVAVIAVTAIGSLLWMQRLIDQDTVTPIVIANPEGRTGKVLLVYHPGLSSFQENAMTAFAEGLVASGWQVSTTTASNQAPSSVTGYDLIALGSPVYSRAPANPLTRYIKRVADFGGKPVVIVLTAAGNASGAIELTEKMVAEAKGRPVRSLGLTNMAPNENAAKYTGSNTDKALQIARELGRSLKPGIP
jgi:flavorubredoxin